MLLIILLLTAWRSNIIRSTITNISTTHWVIIIIVLWYLLWILLLIRCWLWLPDMLETISPPLWLLLLLLFDLPIQILCIFLLQLLLRCQNTTIHSITFIISISHNFIAIRTTSLKLRWMRLVMDMLVMYHLLLLLLLLLHLPIKLIILAELIHEPSCLISIILFLLILLLLLILCVPFQLMCTVRLNTLRY